MELIPPRYIIRHDARLQDHQRKARATARDQVATTQQITQACSAVRMRIYHHLTRDRKRLHHLYLEAI